MLRTRSLEAVLRARESVVSHALRAEELACICAMQHGCSEARPVVHLSAQDRQRAASGLRGNAAGCAFRYGLRVYRPSGRPVVLKTRALRS